jgi:Sulfotransferase family
MSIAASEYRLVATSRRFARLLREVGEIEGEVMARRLDAVPIDRPIFVTGLARSGTTILLTVLARAAGVATHRYRDFPFLDIPLLWNWFQDRFAHEMPEHERAHGDRIKITPHSPEAFEEVIWQSFFPWTHDPDLVQVLGAETQASDFEAYFRRHIRKILLLRRGRRYLSKGNYNVARLRYLARLFPDAHFLVPVREPLSHVDSLARQHARFTGMAREDPHVGNYLEAAGHYEFGPQRRPFALDVGDAEAIRAGWAQDDRLGYAQQWRIVYDFVDDLRREPAMAGRMTVVRYEDLCSDPAGTIAGLLAIIGLDDSDGAVRKAALTITAPAKTRIAPTRAIISAVEIVALRYGYRPGGAGPTAQH